MKAIKQIERLFCKGKGKTSKYFCIYKSGKLKWILPKEKRFALKIIQNWKPYSFKSKLFWKTIEFLYHLRIPNILFNVSSIKFSHENINWEKFGWPYDSIPKLSFYIGNGSSDQKISAIFINKDNLKIINVVKLPLGNNSWNLIKKEFNFLNEMKNKLNQKLPIAIYNSLQNKYTVQSFLEGSPSKIDLTNEHYKFLGSLVYKNRLIELKYLGNYLENYIHNNSGNLEKLKLLKNAKILLSELD